MKQQTIQIEAVRSAAGDELRVGQTVSFHDDPNDIAVIQAFGLSRESRSTILAITDKGVTLPANLKPADTDPEPPYIELDVRDDERNHFIVRFNRPGRVEFMRTTMGVLADVYEGIVDDEDDEPLMAYDSTIKNRSRSA